MKLEEILEDKTQDAKVLVQMLKRKAGRRNPKNGKQNKFNVRGAEDSFTGYNTDTVAQTTWK